jgi:quercetin dioxygenase-like cupin family protein
METFCSITLRCSITFIDKKGLMTMTDNTTESNADNSAIWENHVSVPDTPDGFTVRTTYPTNPDGAEVMLERWQAGSAEPPHSHPGDDMTVVVEGRMAIQFFTQTDDGLIAEGEKLILNKGDTGYIKAGRIHDASYLEDCKLVYVHDKAFGFKAEG